MDGKITIESGTHKAIFDINNNSVQLNFTPALLKETRNENEQFVLSVATIIMKEIKK